VSRWDKAVEDRVPPAQRNRLGIAIAERTYQLYRGIYASERWRVLRAKGARPQRLLFASTGTKDPQASPTLYVEAMVAPDTIDTVPLKTLEALAQVDAEPQPMSTDAAAGSDSLARFTALGIDVAEVAEKLQREGAAAFVKSWHSLMERVGTKAGDAAARRRA
jgi:transaldolase